MVGKDQLAKASGKFRGAIDTLLCKSYEQHYMYIAHAESVVRSYHIGA